MSDHMRQLCLAPSSIHLHSPSLLTQTQTPLLTEHSHHSTYCSSWIQPPLLQQQQQQQQQQTMILPFNNHLHEHSNTETYTNTVSDESREWLERNRIMVAEEDCIGDSEGVTVEDVSEDSSDDNNMR